MDRHLVTFVTVVDKGNFTRAAEQLHLTQSAVSREIDTLEREYESKLLDRTNKFVRLTRAGDILYIHAKNILNEYSRAQALINDLTTTAAGNLSIGASYTFGEYILPHIIAEFKQIYPQITPKITIMNSKRISHLVLNQQVDLGIIQGDSEYKDVLTRPFARDEMVVIIPPTHRLVEVDEITINDLTTETWILRESGSGTRDITDQIFKDLSFVPTFMMEFGSTQIIKESVHAGLGVAIISKFAIQRDLTLNLVHALRIRNYPVSRDFFLATHATQFRTKALECFIDFLYKGSYPSIEVQKSQK